LIEGLKVTVEGKELVELCLSRSEWHAERANLYRNQAASIEANRLEGMHNSSAGNPAEQLKEKAKVHESDSAEMKFIAQHLVPSETYLLCREDLVKLGITKSRY
jgi:hypothetical protein